MSNWNAFATALNISLGAANLVSFFWLIPAIFVPGYSQNPVEQKDALEMALQLGRLDLAVLVLTSVAIGLAIFALWGYHHVERNAEVVAERSAKQEATRVAHERLNDELPGMIADIQRFMDDSVSNDEADRIAKEA